MLAHLQEIQPTNENPFVDCKLGREEYARILTKVVRGYTEGCVLSINGKWGSGKTTFVKMWKKSLENDNFNTLYFNAWEDDFISDPLIGILGQLKALENDANHAIFDSVCNLTLGVLNTVSGGMISNFKDGTEILSNEDTDVVKEYIDKRHLYNEIKEKIVMFVQSCTNTEDEFKPLVFFVDELDRCCPSYAVKVLERIKHLFSIPNVVFVLSVDKEQLCNAIRGYYGSDLIDANEYLRRFIDIEYQLPEPNVDNFCNYLYSAYEFDKFFKDEERKKYMRDEKENEEFLNMAKILFEHLHLSLRQIEKIFAHIRLAVMTFGKNQYANPGQLLLIMCIRIMDNSFYEQLVSKEIKAQDILNHIEDKFPQNVLVKTDYTYNTAYGTIVWEIAQLIESCNIDMNQQRRENVLIKNGNNNSEHDYRLNIKPKIILEKDLLDAIKWYEEHTYRNKVLPIDYIKNHIELVSDFR